MAVNINIFEQIENRMTRARKPVTKQVGNYSTTAWVYVLVSYIRLRKSVIRDRHLCIWLSKELCESSNMKEEKM
jgi:hypothetical protein